MDFEAKSSILKRIALSLGDKTVEFEVNFNDNQVEYDGFKRVINAFSINKNFTSHSNLAVLDVTSDTKNTRLTIVGKDNVENLCRVGSIDRLPRESLQAMIKTEVDNVGPLKISDYGLTINTRKESPVDPLEVASSIALGPKFFRYKQRMTFKSNIYAFRIDCTVVHQTKSSSDDFYLPSIFDTQPRYELEIELVDKKVRPDECYQQLGKLVKFTLVNVENNPYVLTRSVKDAVLVQYLKLVENFTPQTTDRDARFSAIMRNPTRYFIGPKPVSLSFENISQGDPTAVSILQGYTVTDKADGDRMLLMVATDGKCYLLNNTLNVKFTGFVAPRDCANTLLDGEYVDKWKVAKSSEMHSTNVAWFMPFDVYYYKGAFVGDRPLKAADTKANVEDPPSKAADTKANVKDPPVSDTTAAAAVRPVKASKAVATMDRLTIMQKFAESVTTSNDGFVQLHPKVFLDGDIFAATKRVLALDRQYETDGVIFTPAALPVGANYTNEPPKMTGRWTRVLKWKPPEQNTIDFLVRFVSVVNARDVSTRYAKLYVGYAENNAVNKDGTVSPQNVLTLNAVDSKGSSKMQNQYIERQFAEVLLPINDGKCVCHNGDIIMNETIVEFSYDGGASAWMPLRVRQDKTHLFRASGGNIGGTANDYEIAQSIWKTIQHPVTAALICGDNDARDASGDKASIYYMRDTERERLQIKPMLDFHNHWVKKTTVFDNLKAVHAVSLFDIGCGRGGDLYRCINAGFKTIVGLDVSESDLLNSTDGAYVRLNNLKSAKKNVGNEKIVFLQWDCSKAIAKENDTPKQNKELQAIGDVAFGFVPQTAIPRNLAPYYGIANKTFDVVSCQFAIHYFFKTPETLANFCGNVGSRLKKGGFLVLTCMDADSVDKMFAKMKTNTLRGKKSEKDIWMLTKKYDSFDYDDPKKNYGKEIDVFVESINNTVTEYLVDYELLCMGLKEHGIVPSSKLGIAAKTGFRDLFVEMEASYKKGKDVGPATKNAVENMEADEKKFSFLNMVYVFSKA